MCFKSSTRGHYSSIADSVKVGQQVENEGLKDDPNKEVSPADFAEKYSTVNQDEIQQARFGHLQFVSGSQMPYTQWFWYLITKTMTSLQ